MFCSQGWYPTWGRYNPGWELKLDDLVKVRSRVIARSVAAKQSQEINELKNMDHLPFSWWFGPALTLPGQEGRRRRQKRPGFNLAFPILLPFRKETRGERDRLAENGGSPPPAKEEPPLFFGEADALLPGQGTYLPYGKSAVFQTHRKLGLS